MNNNTILNAIKELLVFYVKENYNNYLKTNNIRKIPDDNINNVVSSIYTKNKPHIKSFIKSSLKEMYKQDYPGDLIINNILSDILSDDISCINKLNKEIKKYQDNLYG